jgi:hypothetical protein
VAISHLSHPRTTPWAGLIAAGIWMLMVGASLWATCDDDGGCGLFQFLINRLGAFAGRQFVQIQRPAGESPVVGFGYWIGRHRFYYFRIPISGIDEVHWSTGQATALAGRDMDDWLVCVWYDTESVIGRFGRGFFRGGQGVYCLGESGPKEKTAEFGRRLVAFLREGGADLVEMKEGKWVRRDLSESESGSG